MEIKEWEIIVQKDKNTASLFMGEIRGIKKRSSSEELLLTLNPQRNDYSSFLVFLAAGFLAGFSSAASREAKDGAKDKKRRSNYSFWGFNERGDSTSRICLISLISPRKKLPLFSFFDFFENDSSFHDFLSRGLPHQQAANVESTFRGHYPRTCT